MKPGQAISAGITASAIAHLSIVALLLFFAEVHPFGSVTAEPIAVDIVSSEQVAEVPKEPEPDPIPTLQPSFDLSSKPADPSSKPAASAAPASAAAPEPAAGPQKQAAVPGQRPNQQQAAVQPQPQPQSQPQSQLQPQQPQPQQQSQPTALIPAAIPQEPDVTVKYHVPLGLPQTAPGDGFDAPASAKADVDSDLVAEFRRHLRTCSKLPGSIAASDKVRIVLRIFMTLGGKLAAVPVLIEASASAKGPLLMQSAISALQACQPYAMLPANRYGEWKMLDLSFTPQDFVGG
jgi:hypothetical protein